MWLIIGIVGFVALIILLQFIPRVGRATMAAAPMGNYLRATEKGASAEAAIYDSIQILRYRDPWRRLSDEDLRYAANALAQLPNPKDFVAVVVEVERTGDLAPITHHEILSQFVNGARVLASQRRT